MSRDSDPDPATSCEERQTAGADLSRQSRDQALHLARVWESHGIHAFEELPTPLRANVLRGLMTLRRRRLLDFIAQVIAGDIRRQRQTDGDR